MATKFCYHCQSSHDESQMQLVESRSGKRWRCMRSLDAAKRSLEVRDAFGRLTTERNKQATKWHALRISELLPE